MLCEKFQKPESQKADRLILVRYNVNRGRDVYAA